MSRITEIKANLEKLKLNYWHNELGGNMFQTTLTENIKEADAMISELNNELEWNESLTAVRCGKDCDVGNLFFKIKLRHKKIKQNIEDWQNLKKELEMIK